MHRARTGCRDGGPTFDICFSYTQKAHSFTFFAEDSEAQSRCIYDAYVSAVTAEGVAEAYSTLFPDIAGASDIIMWHHRVGLTTLYYYVNKSTSDELREQMEVALENQAILLCDEIDESLASSPASLIPRTKLTVSVDAVLMPGQSLLYIHRPCSSDGASSSVARSCNIISHISPGALKQMTKEKGEVRRTLFNCLTFDSRCFQLSEYYGVPGIRKYSLQHATMYGILVENGSAEYTLTEDFTFQLVNYAIVDHPGDTAVQLVVPPGWPLASHHVIHSCHTSQGNPSSSCCSKSTSTRARRFPFPSRQA